MNNEPRGTNTSRSRFLECPSALVNNEASEDYLGHQEGRCKGLLSDPEGEFELF